MTPCRVSVPCTVGLSLSASDLVVAPPTLLATVERVGDSDRITDIASKGVNLRSRRGSSVPPASPTTRSHTWVRQIGCVRAAPRGSRTCSTPRQPPFWFLEGRCAEAQSALVSGGARSRSSGHRVTGSVGTGMAPLRRPGIGKRVLGRAISRGKTARLVGREKCQCDPTRSILESSRFPHMDTPAIAHGTGPAIR